MQAGLRMFPGKSTDDVVHAAKQAIKVRGHEIESVREKELLPGVNRTSIDFKTGSGAPKAGKKITISIWQGPDGTTVAAVMAGSFFGGKGVQEVGQDLYRAIDGVLAG